jgi:hypothetical protein
MAQTESRIALLKLIGATILFASAVTQHLHYDQAQDRIREMREAISDQALVEKSFLANQTMMYVLYGNENVPEHDSLRAQHAAQAARKLYMSQVPFFALVKTIPRDEKDRDLATLRKAAAQVSDVESLSAYLQVITSITGRYEDALPEELAEARSALGTANWVYFVLYMLGGMILFAAGWLEWQAAAGKPQARAAKRKG